MRVFIDSDILLDAVLLRNPHYSFALRLLSLNKELCTSAECLLNAYYHTCKYIGKDAAKNSVSLLEDNLRILVTDQNMFKKAFQSDFADLEDAVQYLTAIEHNCKIIITRNLKDYKKSLIPVMTAEQYLKSK